MYLSLSSLLHNGRYRIDSVLGQGGYGITYLGYDTKIDRVVCIKEFYLKDFSCRAKGTDEVMTISEQASNIVNQLKPKFIKEAQTIASINNRHIIRVYDVFEENGTAYYVMEYHSGGTLKEKIEHDGALNIDAAKRYIAQLCDALEIIHNKMILHLDVKPSNVMLSEADGRAILIDFGISKHYSNDNRQTSSAPMGRSKGYAPIEQYDSTSLQMFSPSTDIYSLGATFYYLITGQTPPDALTVYNNGKIQIDDSIDKHTRRIIEKSMMPRKTDRYQSIPEFKNALGLEPDLLDDSNEKKDKDALIRNEKYLWLFLPMVPLATYSGHRSRNYMLSLLYHPWTIGILIAFIQMATADSLAMVKLHDAMKWMWVLVLLGMLLACFVGGIMAPMKLRKIGSFDIPKWMTLLTCLFSVLSMGSSFAVLSLCTYLLSLVTLGVRRIKGDMRNRVPSKVLFWSVSGVMLFASIFVGIIVFFFVLLLCGLDS